MGRAIIEAARPPMWTIAGTDASGPRSVRFGRHDIALSDIAGVSIEEVKSWPAGGLFAGGAAFLFVSAVLAYAVFEAGARERFLIGTVFLAALGIAGLSEAVKARSTSHFELKLTLTNGACVVFTSADRGDIQALALRIAAERGQ